MMDSPQIKITTQITPCFHNMDDFSQILPVKDAIQCSGKYKDQEYYIKYHFFLICHSSFPLSAVSFWPEKTNPSIHVSAG